MKQITIYTDGSCSGNPGPGGWGAILDYKGVRKELSGGEYETTNNRMEMTAVIKALECLREPCEITLCSDSKYVMDALSKGWAKGWRARAVPFWGQFFGRARKNLQTIPRRCIL